MTETKKMTIKIIENGVEKPDITMDVDGSIQTTPVSRRLPPRTCGNRYVEDEDFFFEESECQIKIRESFDKEGKFLIKE